MLRSAQAHLHQGAVYDGVPIAWVKPPLWLMRPKRGSIEDLVPRRMDLTADAFVEDDGQEVVLALAKTRPVVVLSSYAELRRLRQVRVVPLYTYRSNSAVGRMRQEIEDGKVGSAFHLVGDEKLGLYDGALRLDQMQAVDSELLARQVASLADSALAGLMEHAMRYVGVLDRRPAA